MLIALLLVVGGMVGLITLLAWGWYEPTARPKEERPSLREDE